MKPRPGTKDMAKWCLRCHFPASRCTCLQGPDVAADAATDPATMVDKLARQLTAALRYIEVANAYQGVMTAAQVEAEIIRMRESGLTQIQIAANSVHTLATFNLQVTRELLAAVARDDGEPPREPLEDQPEMGSIDADHAGERWTVERRLVPGDRGHSVYRWEVMEGTAHRGLFVTEEEARVFVKQERRGA